MFMSTYNMKRIKCSCVVLTLVYPVLRRVLRGQNVRGAAPPAPSRANLLGDLAFAPFLAGVLGAAAYMAYQWDALRSALIVYCLAGVGIPLVLIQVTLNIRRVFKAVGLDGEKKELQAGETIRRTLVAFAWLLGLSGGVFLIGFHAAVAIFIIVFIRAYGGGWRAQLVLTGLAEAFVVLVFDVLLKVFWPVPALFRLLGVEFWF